MIKSKMTEKLLLCMFLLKRLLTRKQTKPKAFKNCNLNTQFIRLSLKSICRISSVKYTAGEQDSIVLGDGLTFYKAVT